MTEKLTVMTERVDDTPLLVKHQERMGIPRLLNEIFTMHGNWQGLNFGEVVVGWLAHILSEANHRLSHVEPWVAGRQETLSACLGQPVRALDFSDDRLALVLRALSDDEQWSTFERRLNRNLLRVYTLQPETIRIDTTTCSGYWEVNDNGLFQFGHSKDHRPDLPQVKVVLSTLDPLGMPVATDAVPGQRADDPLYIPAIRRVHKGLEKKGLLYVGDSKMGAIGTRAYVEDLEDYYLTPLSRVHLPEEKLHTYLEPIWDAEQELTEIYREKVDGETVRIAKGYEMQVELSSTVAGETVTWTERRLVVQSLKQVRAARTRLQKRLAKAQAAVLALNERGRGKRRYEQVAEVHAVAQAILREHQVEGLLNLDFEVETHKRTIRGYRDRPTRTVEERDVWVRVTVNEDAVHERLRRKGWRVYATNAPAAELPLSQAVLAYRNQYLVERGCGRLKGRPLSVTPMYLQRDDHATGLIRLLTIALRVLTLFEFLVRRRLSQEGTELSGIYKGNPKRSTARPSAELMLEAFEYITLTIVHETHRVLRHLTPLTPVQQRILKLLDIPPDVYTQLAAESAIPA